MADPRHLEITLRKHNNYSPKADDMGYIEYGSRNLAMMGQASQAGLGKAVLERDFLVVRQTFHHHTLSIRQRVAEVDR